MGRVHPDENGNITLKEGDYGKDGRGMWHMRPPGQHAGSIPTHKVTEHEDGTITVKPSIVLQDSNDTKWHGHLKKGIWSEC